MNKILIGSGEDWSFSKITEIYDEIYKVSLEMGYDCYPNQVEIVTAEQMLDAYSSIGLPIMYNHWSFGKEFIRNFESYKKGYSGLAYEMVINSNPCINYLMEQNTMLMQTLVLAHAAVGHNHYFKNNYLFDRWTDPGGIIAYMDYARKFIHRCEEKYGVDTVEKILDAIHSLANVGVFKHPRKEPLSLKKELERRIARDTINEQSYNDLFETTIQKKPIKSEETSIAERKERFNLPEENILYFVEQYSPSLKLWIREVIRICRNINQYFYPQGQTKVCNEGCATWTHYTILHKLYDKGMITDGAMLEFLKSHNGVTFQADFDDNRYSGGLNPYALGYNIMRDIVRICDEPTDEDKLWFPKIAGCKDSFNVLKDAWADYRDESLIRQFLSPTVIRKMKLFSLVSEQQKTEYEVEFIHNERGYHKIRTMLADSYMRDAHIPQIVVSDVNIEGDRELKLEFNSINKVLMNYSDKRATMQYLADLWGYPVQLRTINNGAWVDTDTTNPRGSNQTQGNEIYDDFGLCY